MNGDKNNNLIKVIIQGGLAGSLVLTLILFYSITANHISHNTEVLTRVEASMNNNISIQKDMLKSQEKTLEAIERVNNTLILLKTR